MKDELTLKEKLEFLQREEPYHSWYATEGEIMHCNHIDALATYLTDDYFKARVLDWRYANMNKIVKFLDASESAVYTVRCYLYHKGDSMASVVRLSNKMAGDKK